MQTNRKNINPRRVDDRCTNFLRVRLVAAASSAHPTKYGQNERTGIQPVWMCPLRQRDPAAVWDLYALDPKTLYVNVGEAEGAIEFVMSADTRYFSEQDMVDVLRGMEMVAVEAALDPSTPTGVTESVATPA